MPMISPLKLNGIQKSFFQRRIGWIIFIIPVLFICLAAIFGDNGIFKLWRLKKEIKRFEDENIQLTVKNQRLEKEINLLRTNRKYLETLARKELGYIRKGEKIYWFVKDAEKIEEERP